MATSNRTRRFQRNRQAVPKGFYANASTITATIAISTAKARLTFNAPVAVSGLPLGITRQAAGAGPQLAPTAVTIISPYIIDLTYAASVVATDKITINANVQEIRGVAGSTVAAITVTL
jgi:hypothetical protein